MPKISIIIPTFNSKNYIDKCIVSIINQSYKDFEVVLIDDCSTDGTFEYIIDLFQKNDFNNYIIGKNFDNLGPSLTRKKGIMMANGQYICFCDSDDYYDDQFLEKMVNASKNLTNDIIICAYKSIYSSGKISEHNKIAEISNLQKNEIIAQCTDSLCCMMIRKYILETIDFPDIRNGEDMSIIPVIVQKSKTIGFVDEPLYNYVYRENSLSKKPNEKIIDYLIKSFEYIENNIYEEYKEEIEFLGIKNLLYGGLLNMLKLDFKRKNVKVFYNNFIQKYPNWFKNKYYFKLPLYKKVYLLFARCRLFSLCRIFSKIHYIISK